MQSCVAVMVVGVLLLALLSGAVLGDNPGTVEPTTPQRPNIVFLLSDDQDQLLGSLDAMPALSSYFGGNGTQVDNFFATTPVCCPARASLLTGRYLHNTGVVNNSVAGQCAGPEWYAGPEKRAVSTYLHDAGYKTMYAGKYMNAYGYADSGGPEHVPPGWDNWQALVGNSVYYNYTLSNNGEAEVHRFSYAEDYLTDLVKNRSLEWVKQVAGPDPLFLWMSVPACHQPAVPAPQYVDSFIGAKAPRTPSYNLQVPDRHWFTRVSGVFGPMNETVEEFVDLLHRRRLSTLLSVDDLIVELFETFESVGQLNNTYIFFASDHGYHLGQFGMGWDKRTNYEFDVRSPFFVRGPGIQRGRFVNDSAFATTIDVAPTFLDIAGLPIPKEMDGTSLLPLLTGSYERQGHKQVREETQDARPLMTEPTERGDLLVEYHGENNDGGVGFPCGQLSRRYLSGTSCFSNPQYASPPFFDGPALCSCEDSTNQTYWCVRTFNTTENTIFCSFVTGEVEFYDIAKDPWQLKNTASSLSAQRFGAYVERLEELRKCRGAKECQNGAVARPGWPHAGSSSPHTRALTHLSETSSALPSAPSRNK